MVSVSDIGMQATSTKIHTSHLLFKILNHSKPSLAHPTAGHAVILPSADSCP